MLKIKRTTHLRLNKREKDFILKFKNETNWNYQLFYERKKQIFFLYKNNFPIGILLISDREFFNGYMFNEILKKHKFLTNVFIDKKHRHKGYASILIKKALSCGNNRYNIVVNPDTKDLNSFYEEFGFRYRKDFSLKCNDNLLFKSR